MLSCRDAALKLLVRREHSGYELRCKLLQRGHDMSVIKKTLATLSDEGWQSDWRFAECYVQHRSKLGYGPLRIQRELLTKGVAINLIERLLREGEWLWQDIARSVYQKQSRLQKTQVSIIRHLTQRGFSVDTIQCLSGLFDGSDDC